MSEMEHKMYTPDQLHNLPGIATFEIVAELHAALIGLLWQIDDLKNFDETMWESHFDGTCPVLRAEELHGMLIRHRPKDICDRSYLSDGRREFVGFWDRCRVEDSLPEKIRGVLPIRGNGFCGSSEDHP